MIRSVFSAGRLAARAYPSRCAAPTYPRVLSQPVTATFSSEAPDIDVDGVAYGFMASQALFSALEIGLFDAISTKEGGMTIDEINVACKITAPRLQTLVTALVGAHSLKRDASGKYTLSPNTARFLVKESRAFYGDYLRLQIGRQFYPRMGHLTEAIVEGKAPSYAEWFSDPTTADTYTRAQHNGSVATAKAMVKKLDFLGDAKKMLDVGGGSGAFSYVFTGKHEGLRSTVLDLPGVVATASSIRSEQDASVQARVDFAELDVSEPNWPTPTGEFDAVLMSYVSGSVPEPVMTHIYSQAYAALKPGGKLIVHDFMVDDDLEGPPVAALWALQHVTVNAEGLGLCPANVITRMTASGFDAGKTSTMEMIRGLTKAVIVTK